jgi:hypothetical protein
MDGCMDGWMDGWTQWRVQQLTSTSYKQLEWFYKISLLNTLADAWCIRFLVSTLDLHFFFFLQTWGLNSGSWACYISALPLKPYLKSFFKKIIFQIRSCTFSGLALNFNPTASTSKVAWITSVSPHLEDFYFLESFHLSNSNPNVILNFTHAQIYSTLPFWGSTVLSLAYLVSLKILSVPKMT